MHYDVDMYVERGESPINFIEQMTPDFFPIRSQADWTKFRDMVDAAEGKRNVNARLYTDIAETNVYILGEQMSSTMVSSTATVTS